jgi:hypothetical protein
MKDNMDFSTDPRVNALYAAALVFIGYNFGKGHITTRTSDDIIKMAKKFEEEYLLGE